MLLARRAVGGHVRCDVGPLRLQRHRVDPVQDSRRMLRGRIATSAKGEYTALRHVRVYLEPGDRVNRTSESGVAAG